MRNMINIIQQTYRQFQKFYRDNKLYLIAAFLFSLLCFGFMITHYSLTIDEETWINNTNPSGITLWLTQSRFGVYLFDRFFTPLGRYVPFLWDGLAVLFWTFAGTVFSFCVTMVSHTYRPFSIFALTAMFSSIPLVVGELLSFSLFNLQQALSMVIMAAAVCCIYVFFNTAKKGLLGLSAFFVFLSSSFFQAFPTVFITAVVIYCVLYIKEELSPDYKRLFTNVLYAVGVLCVGVGLFYIVNKLITIYVAPGGSAYLDQSYIGWKSASSLLQAFLRTLKNDLCILLGRNIVGGSVLLVTLILFLIFVIFAVVNRKGFLNRLMLLIFCGILVISPFSLSLLFAMPNIVGRTYLALPLAYGAMLYLVCNHVKNIKWVRQAVVLVVLLLLVKNAAVMNTYFYNSYMVYQDDRAFAQNVMQRINNEGLDYRNKEIVFIGKYDSGIVRQSDSPAFGSFFNWDEGNIIRMVDFLNAEGYSVEKPSEAVISYALQVSDSMACWPEQGCITEENNILIVKLSSVDSSSIWYRVNGVPQ